MIKLDSYTDENVFENAKEYIKSNLKPGDHFLVSRLQRIFSIGYNKAWRVMDMLHKEKVIKINSARLKPPVVL